jgi:hypothetical protein
MIPQDIYYDYAKILNDRVLTFALGIYTTMGAIEILHQATWYDLVIITDITDFNNACR